MIRLVCKKCGQVWYTANTRPNQKCASCGGDLIEKNEPEQKDNIKSLHIVK